MGFVPSLTTWQFAAAGVVLAAVPLLIHLLSRRHPRPIGWAAMDFLQQALENRRQALRLRHFLLLLLRVASVALLGLALAEPYFAIRGQPNQRRSGPVHAVLVIDNSLSMGYQLADGNLLDLARQAAHRFLERLPTGSMATVIPARQEGRSSGSEPLRDLQEARRRIDAIRLFDGAGQLPRALERARRVLLETSDAWSRRVILLSDRQQSEWQQGSIAEFPADCVLDFVDVATSIPRANCFISRFELLDGLADFHTPAILAAQLGCSGAEAPQPLQVVLKVGGTAVATRTATIPANGRCQVLFDYQFDEVDTGQEDPWTVPVVVEITADRLPDDDVAALVVPVVRHWPILFVDQYAADEEDPLRNRLGETRHLRTLLQPTSGATQETASRARLNHVRMDQLTPEMLQRARVVVVGGVQDPGDRVLWLRDYVQQGGQLLIMAGGQFDPQAWQARAWLDGQGILPVPLLPQILGRLPRTGNERTLGLSLDFDSLRGESCFQLTGADEELLRRVYEEPFFFQSLAVELPVRPGGSRSAEAAAGAKTEPRVLARLNDEIQTPLLIERQLGEGRAVLFTSGMTAGWSTLAGSGALVAWDRLVRQMLTSTLPVRNFALPARIRLPIESAEGVTEVILRRPGVSAEEELLEVGYLNGEQRGVTLDDVRGRGLYEVDVRRGQLQEGGDESSQTITLAVQSLSEESDLTPLPTTPARDDGSALHEWFADIRDPGISAGRAWGHHAWRFLTLGVLGLLLAESAVVAWFARH